MKHFMPLYFFFLILLFAFFYAPTTGLSVYINELQNKWTLAALNFFLHPGQLKGVDIWVNAHYKIIITQACNGMIPILFLFASILAYPSTVRHKILWIVIGYSIFFVINVIRILWVVYITQEGNGHDDFHWSHDIVGNALLLLTGVSLFYAYITSGRNKIS